MLLQKRMKMSWTWIDVSDAMYSHDMGVDRYGGSHGVRDTGLVMSAIARPQYLVQYGDGEVEDLAAAYVHGFIKNHGFVDGNKRTSFIVVYTFLRENGYTLDADSRDIFKVLNDVASGDMSQEKLVEWFKKVIKRY